MDSCRRITALSLPVVPAEESWESSGTPSWNFMLIKLEVKVKFFELNRRHNGTLPVTYSMEFLEGTRMFERLFPVVALMPEGFPVQKVLKNGYSLARVLAKRS